NSQPPQRARTWRYRGRTHATTSTQVVVSGAVLTCDSRFGSQDTRVAFVDIQCHLPLWPPGQFKPFRPLPQVIIRQQPQVKPPPRAKNGNDKPTEYLMKEACLSWTISISSKTPMDLTTIRQRLRTNSTRAQ
ncbi:Regulator of telomere elongation helicase 1, partial [Orchesella cincta]